MYTCDSYEDDAICLNVPVAIRPHADGSGDLHMPSAGNLWPARESKV